MLATYKSCGLCWTGFGAVCSQPTGLMGSVGQGFRLYVGNLQVLCALLDRNGAECWQPTSLTGSVGPGLVLYVGNLRSYALCWTKMGLNVGNLQVSCALLDRVSGCMLASYRSYALCWTGFGAVCWQPTGLMRSLSTGFGAVCWQPTGLMRQLGTLTIKSR